LAARSSAVRLPDHTLAAAVWGRQRERWPQQWRQELLDVLQGLTWLHVAPWHEAGPPALGADTALLTHVADLRGHGPQDVCGDDCPARHGPAHHHYLVNVARGFLGILEHLARPDDGRGVRTYDFAPGKRKAKRPTLRKLGRTGQVVQLYLPGRIGQPSACGQLTDRQHDLLRAIVCETTRARQPKGRGEPPAGAGLQAPPKADSFAGNAVQDFHGKGLVPCPLLNPAGRHCGFNGNRKRHGMGYRLMTPGGWLAKAGYDLADVKPLLDDLAGLAGPLGLTVVGLHGQSGRWFSLDQLRGLPLVVGGRRLLDERHLRVYAGDDYLARWDAFFHWGDADQDEGAAAAAEKEPVLALAAVLASGEVTLRKAAGELGADPSFLSKVLRGKHPPAALLDKIRAYVAQRGESKPGSVPPAAAAHPVASEMPVDMLAEARACLERGWCVVPQEAGAKKPPVRWKHLQERRSTAQELVTWFGQWPDAGLAVVLGPVSDLFVIDVDGPEAHAELLKRLGGEPLAPKAVSGSGKPYRCHFYFRCPPLTTRAKQTPWHEHLEFRGKGGIIVIPPSLHPSGRRYAWVPGRSPQEIVLPEVPAQVLKALTPPPATTTLSKRTGQAGKVPAGIDASPRTLRFLSGMYREGPAWNNKLFEAACDLCGRDLPLAKAEPLLLAGARPWTLAEEELARKTIASAYSQPREPGRF
jgi:hypothetical protein